MEEEFKTKKIRKFVLFMDKHTSRGPNLPENASDEDIYYNFCIQLLYCVLVLTAIIFFIVKIV